MDVSQSTPASHTPPSTQQNPVLAPVASSSRNKDEAPTYKSERLRDLKMAGKLQKFDLMSEPKQRKRRPPATKTKPCTFLLRSL